MIIRVDRYKSSDDWTLSKVYIDDKFECYGVEDEYRATKVMHETRIPEGFYNVTLRTYGGHHDRYRKLYPEHRGMLQVNDVPGFKDILIHIGNFESDSSGCLLLNGRVNEQTGKGQYSTIAYRAFYKKVLKALTAGDTVTIIYEDSEKPKPQGTSPGSTCKCSGGCKCNSRAVQPKG